jgi:geranylgeranyl pyrophosphate synthase
MMDILNMYYLKTGKLFEAAFMIPGVISKLSSEKCKILAECGGIVGVLFQISDDINDINSDEHPEIQNIKKSLLEDFNACIKKVENDFEKTKLHTLKKLVSEI